MTTRAEGITDLHNHLVPGVDDGAQTLDEALEGLVRLREAGVEELATTPHLAASLTQDAPALEARLQEMEPAWASLQFAVEKDFPDMAFHRGYEIMLDVPNPDLSDSRLRLGETSYVLVEWPGMRVPPKTTRVLARLVKNGLRPIVAHPERYHGLDRELALPGEWRSAGALLQVNYGSLVGRYGEEPRERAFTFLESAWVDLLSSDFHGRPHLQIYLDDVRELMKELEGEEQFETMARINPSRVLRGEDVVPVHPLSARQQGVWEKVRTLIPGLGRS